MLFLYAMLQSLHFAQISIVPVSHPEMSISMQKYNIVTHGVGEIGAFI